MEFANLQERRPITEKPPKENGRVSVQPFLFTGDGKT
jgi:hypothetical protein